jgi:oligopeptide transport system substrate-binding protein
MGLPEFTLLINSSGNHRIIAEAVQEMWHRELGLNVAINNMEQKSLLSARRSLDYQILRSDWAGDFLDPATFLDVFSSQSGNNHTGWSNPEYDSSIRRNAPTIRRPVTACCRELNESCSMTPRSFRSTITPPSG